MMEFENQDRQPTILPTAGLDVLRQIVELNQSIVKQNALVVQALTLPPMILKPVKSQE